MAKLTTAERFILVRHRMKLTQLELAELLRVCRKTVSVVERGGTVRKSTIERFKLLENRQEGIRRERRDRSRARRSNAKPGTSGITKAYRELDRQAKVATQSGAE